MKTGHNDPLETYENALHEIATKPQISSPWHFRLANLVLPAMILAYGIIALLIKVGILSFGAILIGATPLGIALLATLGVLSITAIFAPLLQRIFFRKRTTETESTLEFPRSLTTLSTARNLTLDFRISFGALAFALTSVVIALMILNPGGIIVGSSILGLIQTNIITLSLAASIGALFGAAVGAIWKRMAIAYANNQGYMPLSNTQHKAPQRAWYLDVVHDIPLYARLFAGIMAGISIASFCSLLGLGLGVLPLGGIALGVATLALASPFLLKAVEQLLPQSWQRQYQETEDPQSKPRYWFDQSRLLEIPWYGRLFLGVASGLALASLFSTGIIIIPAVTIGLSLASPLLFHLVEPLLKKLRASNLWQPTPHGVNSIDHAWMVRLFTGAVVATSLSASLTALGVASGLALAAGLTVLSLAMISPLLFVGLRALTARSRFFQKLLDPRVEIAATNANEKPLLYGQWYIRALFGVIVGGIIAVGLAFTGGSLLAPIVSLVSIAAFVIAPPMIKRLRGFFTDQSKATPSEDANVLKDITPSSKAVSAAKTTTPQIATPSAFATGINLSSVPSGSSLFQTSTPAAQPPDFADIAVILTPEQAKLNQLIEAKDEEGALQFLETQSYKEFSPKYVDANGYTPLFLANKYGLSKVAKRLLLKFENAQSIYFKSGHPSQGGGTWILRTPEGSSLIKGIMDRNDITAFKAALATWGIDHECAVYEDLPMMSYLAKYNRIDMIELAVTKEPTVINTAINRKDSTMLIEAARAGHKSLVEFLLRHGAIVDYVSWREETAQSVASANAHTEISHLLEESISSTHRVGP